MQLQEDTLFDDRYHLIKLLGCGGFSEVWLVEDTKVGNKKMALKVYAPGSGLDEDGVQLFSSEFELVFDLNHTHLLHPAHFDVYERSPYLLMPYSEQGSANKLVGNITEDEAWRFLHDVADGLAYLHEQEPPIIHQDIKPDNVLKDHLGNYQITDFGISTKVRSTLRKSMMSSSKSGGTMAYMPPERFGKDNIPIKASDVWAMGATLFELLTGDMPFGENGGLMQKSGAEIPNIPGDWSKELQEVINRCLLKEPWDRPVAKQVAEWADKRLRGEKFAMSSMKKKQSTSLIVSTLQSKKTKWAIAGLLGAGLLCAAVFIGMNMNRTPASKPTELTQNRLDEPVVTVVPEEKPALTAEVTAIETPQEELTDETATVDIPQTDPEPAPQTTAAAPTTAATSAPPTWIAEYDRTVNAAQTAYNRKDYVQAKEEFSRALNLATRNRDRQKEMFVNGKISEIDKAIEVEKATHETNQKEMQAKLAAYNFVGQFKLGSNHLIVQRKSNNRWGIITTEGVVVEEFNYTQVSPPLKDNCYALLNDKGWVVFDTSLKKIASNLENTNGYR